MKSLEKNKTLVYSVVIFVAAIMAYNYLWKPSQESATAGISAENIGNDVVSLNQGLQAVTLDQTIFSSPGYRSLVDWSPTLSPGPSGRTDPFAPIGQ